MLVNRQIDFKDEEYVQELREELWWAELALSEFLCVEFDGEETVYWEKRYYRRKVIMLRGILADYYNEPVAEVV